MSQTEPNGCSLLQIACKHNNEGICGVATSLAKCEARPTRQECEYCCILKEPQSENMLTLAVARRWTKSKKTADWLFVKMKAIAKEQAEAKRGGPGTELKKLISWLYSPERKKCKCSTRIAKMNKWGEDKCWEKKGTILLWLRQSAKIAKIPYTDVAGLILLAIAIKRSRYRKSIKP